MTTTLLLLRLQPPHPELPRRALLCRRPASNQPA